MEINPASILTTDVASPVVQSNPDRVQFRSPRPVVKADRIQTVDLIRGLALLGILMMNIPGFGFVGFFDLFKNTHNLDFYTFAAVGVGFEGTMRGLFSMLFGAGMVLFTSNKQELADGPTVAEFYYRRLIWLVLFGAFNAYILMWRGDILYYYGLCGMLLYPFRKTKPGWLVVLALTCIGITMFKNQLYWNEMREKRAAYLQAAQVEKAHKKLTPKQQEAKTAWQNTEKNYKPDPERDAKRVKKMRSDYGTVFSYLLPQNSSNEAYGIYHGCWDMLSMMFLGMALLAWGFFSNRLSTSTYVTTLLVGYGLGLPLSWLFFNKLYVTGIQDIGRMVDTYRVNIDQVYDFRRALLAIGHASLLLLVYRSGLVPWLMHALTSVGQMAFTNYLMQSIICTLFFNGYGLGYFGKLSYYQLYYVVAAVWVFQLIISPIWLRYFRFGPFEWLWRSLTYWSWQPMRNPALATA